MPLGKKPRVLKKRNIRRRKGARAQSKQIAALSTQLSKLTKINYARVKTVWQKGNQTINMPAGSFTPYICPIPYAPCIVSVGTNESIQAAFFQDNNLKSDRLIDSQGYGKRFVFGCPDSARNSNAGFHTGGTLRYQMILQGDFSLSQVRAFQKVGMFFIKPKRALADQLTDERKLKSKRPISLAPLLPYPGGEAHLEIDKDYIVHNGLSSDPDMTTYFGSSINTKYWTVVAQRQVAFSHPSASGVSGNANANNASPANNALVASGTFKLPAGGVLKNATPVSQNLPNPQLDPAVLEMSLEDQTNENSLYLVVVQHVTQDQVAIRNGLSLGFIVEDNYKIVV